MRRRDFPDGQVDNSQVMQHLMTVSGGELQVSRATPDECYSRMAQGEVGLGGVHSGSLLGPLLGRLGLLFWREAVNPVFTFS